MKEKFLKIIEGYMQSLARSKVSRTKPKIVAVTGSYGKTSTKEAIFFLLSKKFGSDVGKNWGNMNSVLGLPMAVLGMRKYSFGPALFFDICNATWRYFFYQLPKILVLELGIDKPGEMETLLDIIAPEIAVVTGISEAHLEGFQSLETIKREKGMLVEALEKNGVAILNEDDKNSAEIKLPNGAKKVFVGSNNAEIKYSDLENKLTGISFKLKIKNKEIAVDSKVIGQHSIYALLFAAAVADQFSLDLEEIKKSLEEIRPQNGRMNLIKIKDGITIIDDSYNSNPKSAKEALFTIKSLNFDGRRVAVLGNMNELGPFTKAGHLEVGKFAAGSVDLLLTVGDNAKFLAQGAKEAGMNENKIKIFPDTESLIKEIDGLISAGDLVLVKGSQNRVRLERLVKYLIDNQELAAKILVRQEKKWQK
jgi:UDP-N-acetylmuramoyl-tripeptide--D-alanyl-D-alanine ligase